MLREGFQARPAHIRLISNYGGLGDMIARLPAIKYAIETYTHLSIDVYWQDYCLDLMKLLLPETDRLKHYKASEAKYFGPGALVTFDPNRVTSLGLHLTDVAFLILMDRLPPDDKAKRYPQAPLIKSELAPKEPYIVFTTAYTAKVREWPFKEVNSLAKRCKEQGYTPVLLGSTKPQEIGNGALIKGNIDDQVDKGLFLDLTNQTTLTEALGIIQKGSAVLGVDNGLLHLAHCTSTPVVMGFTSVEARLRLPSRPQGKTLTIEAAVDCYGCQSKCNFIMFDFKKCIFADYLCTTTMTSDRFETALKMISIF